MSTSDDIRVTVEKILERESVKFSNRYMGEKQKALDGDHVMDEWSITFQKVTAYPHGSAHPEYTFEYFTGLGNRAPVDAIARQAQAKLNPRCVAWHDIEKTRKPKAPCAADVLYCLLSDAGAINESFNSWCDTYGYSNDSMKALQTYQACCDTGEKMRALLGGKVMEDLREALQDF